MTQPVTIRNDHIAATIAPLGAELTSLIPSRGGEVMWSADPAVWGWHAPNLFPIVGALSGDVLIHQGGAYPMKRHGFLRHSLCEVVSADPESCIFRLTDNPDTLAQYPFAFDLALTYALTGDRLDVTFTLRNPAATALYASIGAHPAFHWPVGRSEKAAHVVLFEKPELEAIRILDDGLISGEPRPTPVKGQVLALENSLFDRDALIFDRLASRKVVFGAPGGPAVELGFPDFPAFGIWTKPGDTPFLCLEPWQGMASPVGFTGEFADKPGIIALAPGERRAWGYWIRPLPVMPGLP